MSRHRIDRDEIALIGAGPRVRQGRRQANQIFPAGLRLEAHVGAAVLHLAHEIRGRAARDGFKRIFKARRDDALVCAEDGHFEGSGCAAFLIDTPRDLLRRSIGERMRQILRVARVFAHAQVERGARQHQRIA